VKKSSINKKHVVLVLSIILMLLAIMLKLFWLVIFVIVFIGVFYLVFKGINGIKNKVIKSGFRSILFVLIIFISTISFRLFVLDLYKIPSDSMKDTLSKGDVILLNKLVYGPKLPSSLSEIPWLNIWFTQKEMSKQDIINNKRNNIRLQGFRKIKKGDIVVFNAFLWKKGKYIKETLVKRCVGLAGDEIKIKNGEVYVNDKHFNSSKKIKNEYKVWVNNKQLFLYQLDSLKLKAELLREDKSNQLLMLNSSFNDIYKIKEIKTVDSVKIRIEEKEKTKWLLSKKINPNITLDNMGPFKIPKRGLEIQLNEHTYAIYKKVINVYEKVLIKYNKKGFFLNGKKITNYIFKNDYYFMMGDNRKQSFDSRMYGFISKKNIIGKVSGVINHQ